MISELSEGTPVWISTQGKHSPGTVSQQLESPRSYTGDTPTGQIRRNRRHFRCRWEDTTSERSETVENQRNRDSTVRRYKLFRHDHKQEQLYTHLIDSRTRVKKMWNNVLCNCIVVTTVIVIRITMYSGTSENGLPLLRKPPQCVQESAVPNYSLSIVYVHKETSVLRTLQGPAVSLFLRFHCIVMSLPDKVQILHTEGVAGNKNMMQL